MTTLTKEDRQELDSLLETLIDRSQAISNVAKLSHRAGDLSILRVYSKLMFKDEDIRPVDFAYHVSLEMGFDPLSFLKPEHIDDVRRLRASMKSVESPMHDIIVNENIREATKLLLGKYESAHFLFSLIEERGILDAELMRPLLEEAGQLQVPLHGGVL